MVQVSNVPTPQIQPPCHTVLDAVAPNRLSYQCYSCSCQQARMVLYLGCAQKF